LIDVQVERRNCSLKIMSPSGKKGLDSVSSLFPHLPVTHFDFGSAAGLGTFRWRCSFQQGCRGILGPVPPPLSMNGWAMCAQFVLIVGDQSTIGAWWMSITSSRNSEKTVRCLYTMKCSLLKYQRGHTLFGRNPNWKS
jgi:hypothetical protein